MGRSVAQIEKDQAAARAGQAACSANVERYRQQAKAAFENEAMFAKWTARALREEARSTEYGEREAALAAELPEAKRREEFAAHERAVTEHEAAVRTLAAEFNREYPKLAGKLADLCRRIAESDAAISTLRDNAKRVGSDRYPIYNLETIARPERVTMETEHYGLKSDVTDFSKGLTTKDFEFKRKVERRHARNPILPYVNLPGVDGYTPLWGGSGVRF